MNTSVILNILNVRLMSEGTGTTTCNLQVQYFQRKILRVLCYLSRRGVAVDGNDASTKRIEGGL